MLTRLFVVAAAACAALCLAIPAVSSDDLASDEPAAPAGQLDDRAEPTFYRLDFTIDPRQDRFTGRVDIAVRLNRTVDVVWLHGEAINASSARWFPDDPDLDAVAVTYEQVRRSGVAAARFARPVGPGTGRLVITYDAPFNRDFAGLYRVDAEDGESYALTRMEPLQARAAFPSFDEPRFTTPFAVSITTRTGDVAAFNAPVVRQEDAGPGWTRHVFAETPPLATYGIAMAVGPFDVVEWEAIAPNPVRRRAVALRGLAPKGAVGDMAFALARTGETLAALETYLDAPYPFAKLDLVTTPGGPVRSDSSPGLISGHPALWAPTAHPSVRANTLAHQWFGGAVTPAWWDDVWLTDTLALWLSAKAMDGTSAGDAYARAVQRSAGRAMIADSRLAARQIREPVLRNEDVPSAYSPRAVTKGAGVLSMFETYLGASAFRDGVRAFVTRHAGAAATVDNFAAALADGAERPEVVDGFRSFVLQPGAPWVRARLDCSADQPRVALEQSVYRPLGSRIAGGRMWRTPVCVSYPYAGARRVQCTLLEAPLGEIVLDTPACPSHLSPNAGGAGYYRFTLDEAGWRALLGAADRLPLADALALADNVHAGFAAGAVSAEVYLDAVTALARATDWTVATAPADALDGYADRMLDADGAAAMRTFLATVYTPIHRTLRDDGRADTAARANRVIDILIDDAADPDLSAAFAPYGEALVETADWSSVDVPFEARSEALIAAVRAGDRAFLDRALAAALDAPTPNQRVTILGAMAHTTDTDFALAVRQEALSGALTGRELTAIVFAHMANPTLREEAWAWFKANFNAVVARVPANRRSSLPSTAGVFCDAARASEVRMFFEARAADVPGYERALSETLESIELCAALKAAQGEALKAALDARL